MICCVVEEWIPLIAGPFKTQAGTKSVTFFRNLQTCCIKRIIRQSQKVAVSKIAN